MPLQALTGHLLRLLRASERYTKTDMVYLVRNGGWLSFANVLIALISLALSIAFAHFIPKDVYGTYRFLLSIFWTLTAFSLTGIPTVLARAIARGEDGAYPAAVRLSILWNFPVFLIAVCISIYYFFNGNSVLGLGLLVIACLGPFMQSAYLFGSFLEGKRAFKENAIAGLFLNAIPAGVLMLSMVVVRDPVMFLALYLGANVATGMLISYTVQRRHAAANPTPSTDLKSLSGHFSAMNVLFTISQQIDRLLVYHFIGPVQLAIYSFAVSMPDQIKTLFGNVAILALPKFVGRKLEEIKQTLWYRLFGLTVLAGGAALVYIFCAPFLFQLLFPAYPNAIFYSQVYALALIPIGVSVPLTLLEAHAAKKSLYIFNTIGPLFQIVILWFGIVMYGLIGVVIARIVGRTGMLLLGMYLVYRLDTADTLPLPDAA